MAESDGQVVFTVALDDSGFQAGMLRLNAALQTYGQTMLAALSLSAAQLSQAYTAGGRWMERFAVGVKASKSAGAAVTGVLGVAVSNARAAAVAGGQAIGQSMVQGMAVGAGATSGLLGAALTRVVRAALGAAKVAAGIASPSRLFRDEVGRYLALGVQSGFEETMGQSVTPAISQSVSDSVAAGRKALGGTLLAAVRQAASIPLQYPMPTGVSATVLSAASAQATQSRAAQASVGAANVTQNITFAGSMQAPDEVARAIRRQTTYGLAASRT